MRLHRKLARKVQTCQRYRLMGLPEQAKGVEAEIRSLLTGLGSPEVAVGEDTGGIYMGFSHRLNGATFLMVLQIPPYKVGVRVTNKWTVELVPLTFRSTFPDKQLTEICRKKKAQINKFLEDN